MESNIQSSFIPQDAGQPQRVRRAGSSGIADLALMLAILAFAAAAALSVAVYLYLQYENTTAANDHAQLQAVEKQFQPQLIAQLQRLDNRLEAGQTILATHIAPSVFFDLIDQFTAKTISFRSLAFDASDHTQIKLTMDGIGRSVNSIAFQDDLFASSTVFQNAIFSNLDHQQDGVHFHLTATVDPSALNFEKLTGDQSANTPAAIPAPAPSSPVPASPFGTSPPAGQ